jgi:hypothetical protein
MFRGCWQTLNAQLVEMSDRYIVRREDPWVVHKKCRGMGLRSSEVVMVRRRTGRVLYEGLAHDEG